MKKFAWVLSIALLSTSAFAADSVYRVEPMICQGKIIGKPNGMDPGYSQIGIRYSSFLSVRRDGTKAESLQVDNMYFGPGEKIVIDPKKVSETWFMGPLRIDGKSVSRKSVSGRDDDLNLTIVESRVVGNKRQDKLTGSWMLSNTVVGNYGYALRCIANVLPVTNRVLDQTARK